MNDTPDHYVDPNAALLASWATLSEGATNRLAIAHTPAFVTIGLNDEPRIRTVVLRRCDPASRRLFFHTDTRSDKVRDLARNPKSAVHVYDSGQKIQLRLECRSRVLTEGDDFDAAWIATRPFSRECYHVTTGPGSTLEDPAVLKFSADLTADGLDYFAAVEITVEVMEWLYLHSGGHRRARFVWQDGQWTSEWLVP